MSGVDLGFAAKIVQIILHTVQIELFFRRRRRRFPIFLVQGHLVSGPLETSLFVLLNQHRRIFTLLVVHVRIRLKDFTDVPHTCR
jgi:hypothetical protein